MVLVCIHWLEAEQTIHIYVYTDINTFHRIKKEFFLHVQARGRTNEKDGYEEAI